MSCFRKSLIRDRTRLGRSKSRDTPLLCLETRLRMGQPILRYLTRRTALFWGMQSKDKMFRSNLFPQFTSNMMKSQQTRDRLSTRIHNRKSSQDPRFRFFIIICLRLRRHCTECSKSQRQKRKCTKIIFLKRTKFPE